MIFFSISRDAAGFWLEYQASPIEGLRCLGHFSSREAARHSGQVRGWKFVGQSGRQ